jgi:hypothetical protein
LHESYSRLSYPATKSSHSHQRFRHYYCKFVVEKVKIQLSLISLRLQVSWFILFHLMCTNREMKRGKNLSDFYLYSASTISLLQKTNHPKTCRTYIYIYIFIQKLKPKPCRHVTMCPVVPINKKNLSLRKIEKNSMSLFHYLSFLFIQHFLFVKCDAQPAPLDIPPPPPELVPGLYIFGDSYVDVGLNSKLDTLMTATYSPYGIDFAIGATGRFTNGGTIMDYLGKKETNLVCNNDN